MDLTQSMSNATAAEVYCGLSHAGIVMDDHLVNTFLRCQLYSDYEKLEMFIRNEPNVCHAEMIALQNMSHWLKGIRGGRRGVLMWSTYSPCYECSSAIIEFMYSHRIEHFEIKFCMVYKHYKSYVTKGLKDLYKHGIVVDVFSSEERQFIEEHKAWYRLLSHERWRKIRDSIIHEI